MNGRGDAAVKSTCRRVNEKRQKKKNNKIKIQPSVTTRDGIH